MVDDWETKMIGFGCDGTNTNMAEGGLRGLLVSEVVVSCSVAINDALKNTYFGTIDELILLILYENTPKNVDSCRT